MISDGKCKTKYCRNSKAKGRNVCHKCHSRRHKENNPISYTFNALRNNAKRRGKEFKLTITEFRELCAETGYMEGKGKGSKNLSIDRIDHRRGYEKSNIQILPLGVNGSKGYYEGSNEDLPF